MSILVQDGIDPADLSEEHTSRSREPFVRQRPLEPGMVPIEDEEAVSPTWW